MRSKFTEEDIKRAVADSISFAGVVRRLNAGKSGSSHQWIKRRIISLGIDYSHFTHKPEIASKRDTGRKKPDAILIKLPADTKAKRSSREHLLYAMLSKGIAYHCAMADCPNPEPVWKGKALPLEIDHIDGDWRNNLLENLRFLCPNCHHQTETNRRGQAISASSLAELESIRQESLKKRNAKWKEPCPCCGEPKKKESKFCFTCQKSEKKQELMKRNPHFGSKQCPKCGKEKDFRSKLCRSCNNAKLDRNTRTSYPPIEELVERVRESSFLAVSKELGVSDNAVRKYLRNRGVDVKALARTRKQ